jgi:hypothetical protein
MLTVVVGLESSGANKMRKPLASSLYSVMPSTLVICVIPAGGVKAILWVAAINNREPSKVHFKARVNSHIGKIQKDVNEPV